MLGNMKLKAKSSRPAPGELLLVQEFVNTLDVESGEDGLANPASASEWLMQAGLLARNEGLSDEGLQQIRRVREAIRSILLCNAHGGTDKKALAMINSAAQRGPLAINFADGESAELKPLKGGVDGALSRLLAAIFRAMNDGTWKRLKACQNDGCHWAFYDHSKNQSGTWCSMAICGSRMKARAYRRRQETGAERQ